MSKRETLNIESMETILENNDEQIRNIRNLNEAHYTELQHRKKAIIVTYGCQMN